MLNLSNVVPGVKVDEIRSATENNIKQNPLHAHLSAVHMAQDGRVTAKTLGIDSNDPESNETQKVIWAEMLRLYGIMIGITVQGNIMPALEILDQEHRITKRDVFELCHLSNIVPNNREEFWAKGLHFGFEQDYSSSIHLLCPQIEHLVRTLMKQKELKTSTLDSNGIETENGLSTLMDDPEIESILGKDLAFEFKALLSDPFGSNLRNKVAHGLGLPPEN